MSLLAALKLPAAPRAAPPAQPEPGVRGRDAAAFEQAKKLRDGMKDALERGWREAIDIAKHLAPGVKKGFVSQLQAVDKKRQEAKRLDGDPPGQVVLMAGALMGLKQARQAVGHPVSDGTDADTAYKSKDGISVEKPTGGPPAPPPPVVAKEDGEEEQDSKKKSAAAKPPLPTQAAGQRRIDVTFVNRSDRWLKYWGADRMTATFDKKPPDELKPDESATFAIFAKGSDEIHFALPPERDAIAAEIWGIALG